MTPLQDQVQRKFLNTGGLDVLSKWFEKMPDGSPPGQTMKRKLIDIINVLPVDYDHVTTTELGKHLYELFKKPE